MFPYQLSQLLADERIHDMVAAAEHRKHTAAAGNQHRDLDQPLSRLRAVAAQIVRISTSLNGRRGVHASSTMSSPTAASPMGCAA